MKTIRRFAVAWMWMPILVAVAAEPPPGTPPKVISQVLPEYPYALRASGNKGEVLIEFIVDSDGEIRSPVVLKSSHPEFEAPAIEALLKWKFKPGVVDGRRVNTRLRQPIAFNLTDGRRFDPRGVEPFQVADKAPKNVPPEFQYDKPPRAVLTGAPVYPRELLEQKIRGSALIVFVVDPQGRTRQVAVKEATHPEFGAAAVAMIGAWEFEPAEKDGKPSWALLSRKQVFDLGGRDSPVNESAQRLLKALKKTPSPIFENLRELDGPPKPRYQPSPIVPDAMRRQPESAQAVIEFVIDRAGRAQLPRVMSASRDDFGWAAATAVARWRFTPATKDGKPVDVKTRIPVKYVPPTTDQSDVAPVTGPKG